MSTAMLAVSWLQRLALGGLFLCAGCLSQVPLQPASVVPRGTYRMTAQATVSPWCGLSGNPLQCQWVPNAVPLPEARVGLRAGLAEGWEVDGDAHVHGVTSLSFGSVGGVEWGGQLGLKRELWSRALASERRQLVSAAPGVGFTVPGLTSTSSERQLELTLPVSLGHQTEHREWVVSPRLVERIVFSSLRGGEPSVVPVTEVGLAVGMFDRRPPYLGLQLAYQAAIGLWARGLFTFSAGIGFDLGGAPATPAAPAGPPSDGRTPASSAGTAPSATR